MTFEWLSTTACPSCNIIPTAAQYDEFGYPICPHCGTIIRSPAESEQGAVVHAETD